MSIREDLELDIGPALRAVDSIEQRIATAFDQAAQVGAVAITDALAQQQFTLTPDADLSGVEGELADALASPPTIELDGDASAVGAAIGTAVDVTPTVQVDGDASDVTEAIDAAVAAADTTVDVVPTVDTSSIDAASGSLDGLGAAGDHVASVAALAGGSVGGLTEIASGLPGPAKGAAVALGAIATTAGLFFNEALSADTQTRRFHQSLGDLADDVDHIDVGGLNEDLSTLALRLGSDDDAVRGAVASLAELGKANGNTRGEIARTSEEVVGLAARAVALNPSLGDVGSVAERMSTALARGGRFAAQYGIALTSAEIQTRALRDTGKSTTDQLTQYDLAAAGAAISTERLGTHMRDDIDRGASSAEIRLASMKQRLSEAFERFGAPLIEPVIELFTELEPVAEDLGQVFADLARVGIPLFIGAVETIGPPLHLVTQIIGALLDAGEKITTVLDRVPGLNKGFVDFLGASNPGFKILGNAIDGTSDSTEGLKDAFADASAGIADSLANIDTQAGQHLGNAGDTVVDFSTVVQQSLQTAADAFTSKMPTISAAVDKALGDLKDGFNLGDFIADLDRQAGDIKNFFDNVAKLAGRGVDDVVEVLLEKGPVAGGQLAAALASANDKQFNATVASIRNFQSQTERGVQITEDTVGTLPGTFGQVARDVAKAFNIDLTTLTGPEFVQFVELLKKNIEDAKTAASQGGHDIGANLGDALAQAMLESLGGVRSASLRIVGTAVGVVQGGLGIRSPSRVFFDIGRQTVQGLVDGLDDVRPVESAAARLAAAVVPTQPVVVPVVTVSRSITATPTAAPVAPSTPHVVAGVPTLADGMQLHQHFLDTDPDVAQRAAMNAAAARVLLLERA